MDNNNTNELGSAVFFLDVLATVITFLLSFYCVSILRGAVTLSFSSHLFLLPLFLVLITTFMSYFGAYRAPHKVSRTRYGWTIFRTIVLTVGILLTFLFFLKIKYVSRFVIITFAIGEFISLFIIHAAAIAHFKKQVEKGEKVLRVLIIGTGSRTRSLIKALRQQEFLGVKVIGLLDPDPSAPLDPKPSSYNNRAIDRIPIIGAVNNIAECLKNNVIDEVIIAIPRSQLENAEPIVIACEEEGIRIRFMADVFNVQVARMSLTQVGGIPLLTMESVSQNKELLVAKRVFDLTLTILAIPFLIPLFLVVAIAIKIDSPGPVFFIQKRVGLRKHIFPMLKFRSMYLDAEEKLKDIEHLNEAEGPIFKIANDPRVTKVGNFIRKTSIDELPQLINVLRGEMSLVGPRPMSLRDVDLFDRGIQRKRFSVQPGLTCLWQISGRSNLPFEQWLNYDLEYIENWSFWFDVKILLKTLPAVLNSKGAV